jgi:hypothetical protein
MLWPQVGVATANDCRSTVVPFLGWAGKMDRFSCHIPVLEVGRNRQLDAGVATPRDSPCMTGAKRFAPTRVILCRAAASIFFS